MSKDSEPVRGFKTGEEVFKLRAAGIDTGEAMIIARPIPTTVEEYVNEIAKHFGIEVVRVGEDEFREEAKDTRLFLLPLREHMPGAKGIAAIGFRDGVGIMVFTWFYIVFYGVGSGYTYFVKVTPEERVIIRIDKELALAASTMTE
mgnify:CR=1 FL=1